MNYTSIGEIARKKALSEALLGIASQNQNPHWGSALSRGINAYAAAKLGKEAVEAQSGNEDVTRRELARILNPHQAREVTPSEVSGFGGQEVRQFSDPTMEQDALQGEADFWSTVSQEKAQADQNFAPQSPLAQNLQIQNQAQRMRDAAALERAQASGFGSSRQFAGDPVVERGTNNIIGYAQTNTGGPPVVYSLSGGEIPFDPNLHQVLPNAAMGNMIPEVLRAATPTQAENAGAIEAAEQGAMTAGANERARFSTDQDIRQNQITGVQDTDLENLEAKAATAANARRDIEALERALEMNETSPTGTLGNVITAISGVFDSAGIPSDLYTDAQTLQANSGEILARYMQELGARGLTDRDMDVLRSTLPNLTQSAEARRRVIEVLMDNKRRDIDTYADMYSSYGRAYDRTPVTLPVPSTLFSPVGGDIFEQADAIINGR